MLFTLELCDRSSPLFKMFLSRFDWATEHLLNDVACLFCTYSSILTYRLKWGSIFFHFPSNRYDGMNINNYFIFLWYILPLTLSHSCDFCASGWQRDITLLLYVRKWSVHLMLKMQLNTYAHISEDLLAPMMLLYISRCIYSVRVNMRSNWCTYALVIIMDMGTIT